MDLEGASIAMNLTVRRATLIAHGIVVLMCGCASRQPSSTGDPASTSAAPSRLEPIDTVVTVSGEDILRPVGETQVFTVLDGTDGDQVRRTTEPTTEFASDRKEVEPDRRTQYVSFSASGDVLLHAVLTYRDNAIAIFDPPLAVFPATIGPDTVMTSESKMHVVDAKNRSLVKARGTCTREIRHVGSVRIHDSTGPHDTAKIEIEFRSDLGIAKAVKRSTLYVEPGVGIRREVWTEKIMIGFLPRNDGQTLELIPSHSPDGD